MEKPEDRYDSNSTTNRISKMIELMSVKYTSIREDISQHIDGLEELLEHLEHMGIKLDDTLFIVILAASNQVSELAPITVVIKTLSKSGHKWESVSSRFIEKAKTLNFSTE